jgi:hypothetical protein
LNKVLRCVEARDRMAVIEEPVLLYVRSRARPHHKEFILDCCVCVIIPFVLTALMVLELTGSAVLVQKQQAAVSNTLACAECCKTLPSMKRCTQCRAVLYCSRECQVKHWSSHKEACKRLPQEMRERAHKLAEQVTLQEPRFNFEPTPSWKLGAPSDLDVARMEHGGAELRGPEPAPMCFAVPCSRNRLPVARGLVWC